MEERLVRKLMASIKCGSCVQHYEPINIDVLAHSEETWLLRAQCASCYTQSLVVTIIKGERKPEVVTDLTRVEILRFRVSSLVGEDDVLDMHRFLTEFDGDFAALFGERR
jgi:hypothetical protein